MCKHAPREVPGMYGGVEARVADKVWKKYLTNPTAAIPALLQNSGHLDWITFE